MTENFLLMIPMSVIKNKLKLDLFEKGNFMPAKSLLKQTYRSLSLKLDG